MASKESSKPYKGRPNKNKKKSKSVQLEPEVIPDTETTMEADSNIPEVSNSGPTRHEFQELSKTVHELTDLIKSLKNDLPVNVVNTNLQSKTIVAPSEKQVGVDSCSNVGLMATDTNDNDQNPDLLRVDGRDTANGSQMQSEVTPMNLNQINDSIANHLSNLMGPEDSFPKPGNYEPNDQPVDLKVSEKIRNMIWANQYIDLAVLLDPSLEQNKPKQEFMGQSGETITITPKKAARYINGLGQWCSAFTVFINIYCQKFPNELPMLFTYMNTIKKLAHRNGLYLVYDEEFRYMRQYQNLPWNITHSGLWLECRDHPNQSKNQKGGKQKFQNGFRNQSFDNGGGRKQTHPKGFCFRFHSFGKCGRTNCNYIHTCYNPLCKNQEHPIIRCPNGGKVREQDIPIMSVKTGPINKTK